MRILKSSVFFFFPHEPSGYLSNTCGGIMRKKKINKKLHFISKGQAFYLTLKNSSIFWHSAGTYVSKYGDSRKKKSQNLKI